MWGERGTEVDRKTIKQRLNATSFSPVNGIKHYNSNQN